MSDIMHSSARHTPPHLFRAKAVYMITAGTLNKLPYLNTGDKKSFFYDTLIERAEMNGFIIEAWSIFSNHYHFIARAVESADKLTNLIRAVHSLTSHYCNTSDGTPGRKIWYNYWDTCITDDKSYLARLNYVHNNPMKHGVVEKSEDYPFCSYRWFMETANTEFQHLVKVQPFDQLKVLDDF